MNDLIDSKTNKTLKQFVLWFVLSVIIVFVLSLVAAHLPAAFKKLVLFHALWGIGVGYCLRRVALELECLPARHIVIAGVILILLGSLHLARLSHQEYFRYKQSLAAQNPDQMAALKMIEQISGDDPINKAKYEQAKREFAPRFTDYLSMRMSAFGNWPQPWPIVFWSFELFLSALLGGWVLSCPVQSVQKSENRQAIE